MGERTEELPFKISEWHQLGKDDISIQEIQM